MQAWGVTARVHVQSDIAHVEEKGSYVQNSASVLTAVTRSRVGVLAIIWGVTIVAPVVQKVTVCVRKTGDIVQMHAAAKVEIV